MPAASRLKATARDWLKRGLPPCRTIARLVSDTYERRLTLGERVRMRLHLALCAVCARYEWQLAALRVAARQYGVSGAAESTPHASLAPEARERIRPALARCG